MFGGNTGGFTFGGNQPAGTNSAQKPNNQTSNQPTSGLFGAPAPGGSLMFGAASAAPVSFGATPSNMFGAAPSAPFGASNPATFGAIPSAPFGAANPTSFGAAPTAAFGAAPANTFGAAAPTTFGAAPATTFGAANPTTFGAAPSTTFGAAPSTPFGAAPTTTFGSANPSTFGAANPTTFAATPSATFGAAPGAVASTTFGAAPSAPFGAANPTTFGATPTPTSTFGAAPSATIPSSTFGATPIASSKTTPLTFAGFGAATPAQPPAATSFNAAQPTANLFNAVQTPGPLNISDLSTTPAATKALAPLPSFSVPAATTSSLSQLGPAKPIVPAPTAVKGSLQVLKNKTMQEILNRWNQDLEKYTKDVSSADRQILENGHNISKLFSEIKKVQESSSEITASLEYIESQQQVLSSTLDVYEAQLRDMYEKDPEASIVTAPVDTQREYTYDLADSLNCRLDDIGKAIDSIVSEIGNAGGVADPNSSSEGGDIDTIVQILGQHLASLQWLDGSVDLISQQLVDIERMADSTRDSVGSGLGSLSAATPRRQVGFSQSTRLY